MTDAALAIDVAREHLRWLARQRSYRRRQAPALGIAQESLLRRDVCRREIVAVAARWLTLPVRERVHG